MVTWMLSTYRTGPSAQGSFMLPLSPHRKLNPWQPRNKWQKGRPVQSTDAKLLSTEPPAQQQEGIWQPEPRGLIFLGKYSRDQSVKGSLKQGMCEVETYKDLKEAVERMQECGHQVPTFSAGLSGCRGRWGDWRREWKEDQGWGLVETQEEVR